MPEHPEKPGFLDVYKWMLSEEPSGISRAAALT